VEALLSIVPHLGSEQKKAIVSEALAIAKTIANERARAESFGSLAPYLSPDQKIKTLAEALASIKVIGEEEYRAQALGSVAPHLPLHLMAEALAIAKRIGNEQYRAQALGSLAAYIPPSQGGALIKCLLEVAARLPRNRALEAVSASTNIAAALGGAEAVEDMRRAISDTASWYP
jgi:hypothetical protein